MKTTLNQLKIASCLLTTCCLLNTANCFAARVVLNNNVYFVINEGAYLVIDTSSTFGITTLGTGGNIISEADTNRVKWNIGTDTGLYKIPFSYTDGSKIPFTFNVTSAGTGSGSLTISTYYTDVTAPVNNRPLPFGVTNLNNQMGVENDIYVADRFWNMDVNGYTTNPTADLVFTYRDAEWDASGGSRNTITEIDLRAQRWNGSAWQTLTGTDDPVANTVSITDINTFSQWSLYASCTDISSIAGDTSVCKGMNTTLTASGGTNYLWNTSATTAAINVSPLVNTIYTVIISTNSCSDTASATITVNPTPVITTSDVSVLLGESVIITANATGSTTYTWTPSTDLSCTICQSPTAKPITTTTYYVMATGSNTCISTDSVIVTIIEPLCEVFVPNAFSPNIDGNNDFATVYGNCIKEFVFVIYNRWGEKVFETTNQQNGWDGTYKGKAMNTAVFVYYLTATLNNGSPFTRKGNISLMR